MPAPDPPAEKLDCFVLSPIGKKDSLERTKADQVLKHLIRKALDPERFKVLRADEDPNPGAITPQIIAKIFGANLIVADLSGLNANVFYELAVAHGFRKPVVHIQQESDEHAFDVKDMRIVDYDIADPDKLEEAQRELKDYADFAVANPEMCQTPLTDAASFELARGSKDPVAESNVQIFDEIAKLRSDLNRFVANPARGGSNSPPGAINLSWLSDAQQYQAIIDRLIADSTGYDLEDILGDKITATTTTTFDDWVRGLARRHLSHLSSEELDSLL
jgi:hypothetical protein